MTSKPENTNASEPTKKNPMGRPKNPARIHDTFTTEPASDTPRINTSIWIPKMMHYQLKLCALEHNMTASKLYQEALSDVLKKYGYNLNSY